MTTLDKQAHEAAIDHGMWLAPDDDETNYQAFVAGYLRGYSDRGVEAAAARDEYEKEIATLRARVAELEGMLSEATLYLDGSYEDQLDMEHRIVVALRGYPHSIPLPGAEG